MAQSDSGDCDGASSDSETVEVEILYTAGAYKRGVEYDTDSEAFALGRDLRAFGSEAFGHIDRPAVDILDVGYVSIGSTAVSAARVEDVPAFLQEIFESCQGGRDPKNLPYDGREHRSMAKGDIVVLDGVYYVVDGFGFDEVHYDPDA